MPNNFKNDDFEDIYSNTPSVSKPKFTVEINDDDFQDISSFSEDYGNSGEIKYNSSANNRRRQEFSFDESEDLLESEPKEKKKKKRKSPLSIIAIILAIVLIFTGCIGIYGYSTAKKLVGKIAVDEPLQDNIYISDSELYKNDKQVNILLIGSDAREKNVSSRSDTMMLMTIDYENNQIKLTSFLRDSYVRIANSKGSQNKLNAAFAWGGIQMLIDTLELNFKVEIPYYMIVDFEIFESIVDELDGVDIEVSEKEAKYINSKDHMNKKLKEQFSEDISSGVNHFNGAQALWYSRIRYLDTDFMRTQRQRKVIQAIISKAKTSNIPQLLDIADNVMPMIRTNVPSNDMMTLGIQALTKASFAYDVVQFSIPADGTWSNKTISGAGACLVLDMDENARLLHEFLSEKQLTDEDKA